MIATNTIRVSVEMSDHSETSESAEPAVATSDDCKVRIGMIIENLIQDPVIVDNFPDFLSELKKRFDDVYGSTEEIMDSYLRPNEKIARNFFFEPLVESILTDQLQRFVRKMLFVFSHGKLFKDRLYFNVPKELKLRCYELNLYLMWKQMLRSAYLENTNHYEMFIQGKKKFTNAVHKIAGVKISYRQKASIFRVKYFRKLVCHNSDNLRWFEVNNLPGSSCNRLVLCVP